jgi:hypothetical protein
MRGLGDAFTRLPARARLCSPLAASARVRMSAPASVSSTDAREARTAAQESSARAPASPRSEIVNVVDRENRVVAHLPRARVRKENLLHQSTSIFLENSRCAIAVGISHVVVGGGGGGRQRRSRASAGASFTCSAAPRPRTTARAFLTLALVASCRLARSMPR